MLRTATDTYEERYVLSIYAPNAFIQTILPVKSDSKRIIMNIRGKLVKCLMDVDMTIYGVFLIIERVHKVL